MKEEWLLNDAAVPVTCETVTALVAEIKRLIDVVGGMALARPEPDWDAVGEAHLVSLKRDTRRTFEDAAVRAIERLREDQQGVDAVDTLTEEGWIWDGDQWQRPAFPAVINMENFVGSGKPVVFNDLTSLKHKKTVGPIESAMREQRIQDGDLMNVMRQAVWDTATVVPNGDIRALKHRIYELEGGVLGYKKIVADQEELLERQTARIVDLQTHIDNFDGEDR